MSYEIPVRERYEYTVELPSGVTAVFEHGMLTVTGPKGAVTKKLQSKDTKITVEGSRVNLETTRATKRHKREAHTFRSHINNMIEGTTNGHTYKVQVASSHFPMTVKQEGDKIVVKNFVGEKKARAVRVPAGVTVKVSGDMVEIESVNLENAGNFAGSLEKLCVRPNFDNRIFQDGLYIVEKNGRKV